VLIRYLQKIVVVAPGCAGAHIYVAWGCGAFSALTRGASAQRCSTQAEEAQDEQDDDDQANNVDDRVHSHPTLFDGASGFDSLGPYGAFPVEPATTWISIETSEWENPTAKRSFAALNAV
jgi:hypothetical protein